MKLLSASSRRLTALVLVTLLCGCSTTAVLVKGSFPHGAVVEKLPLKIGVYFDDAFRSYTLKEPVPQRGDWQIDVGSAQVGMFRAILPSMFESVVELDDPAAAADVDAVLVPEVDAMQFAIPFQTKSNFFEIWIRYQLTLREPGSDKVIASWPLTGYGRTRDAMLSSAQEAIDQAAIVALRDAAAFLAIDFVHTRELGPWLASKGLAPGAAGGNAPGASTPAPAAPVRTTPAAADAATGAAAAGSGSPTPPDAAASP